MASPFKVALIGSPWVLALLHCCMNHHQMELHWHAISPYCLFRDNMPLSIEALTCYGLQSYGLPVSRAIPPVWAFWKKPGSSLRPSIQELQDLWPDQIPLSARLYLLEFSAWQQASLHFKYHNDPILLENTVKGAHIGPICYQGVIWLDIFGPDSPIVRPDYSSRTTIYCLKWSDHKISLSQTPSREASCIRWTVWDKSEWKEQWFDTFGQATWTLQTPFCLEKFLNQKKLLDFFLKKVYFHARQSRIRVR